MRKSLSQADLPGFTDKQGIAEHIGVGPKTITKMMNEGNIPYVKFGHGRRSIVRFCIAKVDCALLKKFEVPIGKPRARFPQLEKGKKERELQAA